MAKINLRLNGQLSAAIVKASLLSDKRTNINSFMRNLPEAVGALSSLLVQITNEDDVAASGIITILDYTKATDGDTYRIGELVLTAKSSGAAGAQFNIGATNAATATNLSNAINANATYVRAGVAAAVVTVTCNTLGAIGNAIPMLIVQNTGGSASCSAALASGVNDTASYQDYRSF